MGPGRAVRGRRPAAAGAHRRGDDPARRPPERTPLARGAARLLRVRRRGVGRDADRRHRRRSERAPGAAHLHPARRHRGGADRVERHLGLRGRRRRDHRGPTPRDRRRGTDRARGRTRRLRPWRGAGRGSGPRGRPVRGARARDRRHRVHERDRRRGRARGAAPGSGHLRERLRVAVHALRPGRPRLRVPGGSDGALPGRPAGRVRRDRRGARRRPVPRAGAGPPPRDRRPATAAARPHRHRERARRGPGPMAVRGGRRGAGHLHGAVLGRGRPDARHRPRRPPAGRRGRGRRLRVRARPPGLRRAGYGGAPRRFRSGPRPRRHRSDAGRVARHVDRAGRVRDRARWPEPGDRPGARPRRRRHLGALDLPGLAGGHGRRGPRRRERAGVRRHRPRRRSEHPTRVRGAHGATAHRRPLAARAAGHHRLAPESPAGHRRGARPGRLRGRRQPGQPGGRHPGDRRRRPCARGPHDPARSGGAVDRRAPRGGQRLRGALLRHRRARDHLAHPGRLRSAVRRRRPARARLPARGRGGRDAVPVRRRLAPGAHRGDRPPLGALRAVGHGGERRWLRVRRTPDDPRPWVGNR